MSQPLQVTPQQVAAAKLQIVLDDKLGRPTPEIVHRIATTSSAISPTQQRQSDQVSNTEPETASDQSNSALASSSVTELVELRKDITRAQWPFFTTQRAISAFDTAVHRFTAAWRLALQAQEANTQGDHLQAERLLQQAISTFGNANRGVILAMQASLAETYQHLGQPQRALSSFKSLVHNLDSDDYGRGLGLLGRAALHLKLGKVSNALGDASQALGIFRSEDARDDEATALELLSAIHDAQEDNQQARESAEQAARIREELRHSS